MVAGWLDPLGLLDLAQHELDAALHAAPVGQTMGIRPAQHDSGRWHEVWPFIAPPPGALEDLPLRCRRVLACYGVSSASSGAAQIPPREALVRSARSGEGSGDTVHARPRAPGILSGVLLRHSQYLTTTRASSVHWGQAGAPLPWGGGERGWPPSFRAVGDYRALAVWISEGSAKGWSMATAGSVNHCAPSAATWKWSSSRMPNSPGTTIIGSLLQHIPGCRG